MREYFTIVVKENSNENLGLLTEKLNSGFHVDRYYEVGKGGIFILEKFVPTERELNLATEMARNVSSLSATGTSIPTRG